MNILIAIPSFDRRIDMELVRTLLYLERSQKHDLDYIFPNSSLLCHSRNKAGRSALDSGSDYLLFLDSDISIHEPVFIDNLLDTGFKLDAKIICGAYRIKERDLSADRYVMAMDIGRGTKEQPVYQNLKECKTPQLIDAGGTGIMLIHKEVLLKMPEPWFTIVDGTHGYVFPEDWNFCKKAKELGFKTAVDPRFATRHIGAFAWEHPKQG